jgi:hypothetical protein
LFSFSLPSKDWSPILNFIEKVIKQFWKGSIACGIYPLTASYICQLLVFMLLLISEMFEGDSSNKATSMVQGDQLEKVDLDVNNISVETGKISNLVIK